jgi:hypothetical protein
MYYIFIKDEKINGCGQCQCLNEDYTNLEVTEEVYNAFVENPDKYIYQDGEIVENPNYEQEQAKKERERLDNLSMTRGDVFEALILAKGLGKAQIRAMIEKTKLDDITKALYLNRFDEALEFYRGYPIFDMLGQALGITGEMLDKFFDTKNYHYLTTCKLTIKPTPEEATVTIEPDPTPYGETAHYKVECEGYVTQEGDVEMLQNTELEIELEAIEETSETEEKTEATDKDNLTVGEDTGKGNL